jgi:hypothetical protein
MVLFDTEDWDAPRAASVVEGARRVFFSPDGAELWVFAGDDARLCRYVLPH